VPSSRPVGFGEALRRGFGAAKRARGVVGLAFLAEVGTDLLSLGVTVTLWGIVMGALGRVLGRDPMAAFLQPEQAAGTFLGQVFQQRTLVPLAGVVLVAALLSLALRLLWFSAGARTFGLSLAGEQPPRAMAAVSHLHRTIPVAALFLPIYAAVMLYDFAALGSGGIAYLEALKTHSGGFAGALSLALATALALLLGFFADAMLRLSLVRAVTHDCGPIEAVAGAAKLFGSSVPTLLGLGATFGVLAFFAAMVSGTGGAVVVGTGPAAVVLVLYARALTGLAGSAMLAFLQTAELGCYAALDAGERGVLPDPPPQPAPPPAPLVTGKVEPDRPLETVMVVQTEPVLETVLAPPPPAAPDGEKKE